MNTYFVKSESRAPRVGKDARRVELVHARLGPRIVAVGPEAFLQRLKLAITRVSQIQLTCVPRTARRDALVFRHQGRYR